jgi:DNA-binding HxlR family transcriptional regulator
MEYRDTLPAADNGVDEEQTMKSYGQFCPVAKAAELFCERWTPLIFRNLAMGATRFSEIHRGVPLMSPTLLTQRLRQLEEEGVVERRPAGKSWTYHMTPAGAEFVPLVLALSTWGQRWARRQLADNEVDLGLLVWMIESGAWPGAFGDRRTVVRLEFSDQPRAKRLWWFVNLKDKCELCLKDPGFDVDLFLTSTLRDMIYVIRGDLPLSRALATGQLEAHGPTRMQRALAKWLNLGPHTRIKSQRADAIAI